MLKKHLSLDRKPTTDQSKYTSSVDLSFIRSTQRSVSYGILKRAKMTQMHQHYQKPTSAWVVRELETWTHSTIHRQLSRVEGVSPKQLSLLESPYCIHQGNYWCLWVVCFSVIMNFPEWCHVSFSLKIYGVFTITPCPMGNILCQRKFQQKMKYCQSKEVMSVLKQNR